MLTFLCIPGSPQLLVPCFIYASLFLLPCWTLVLALLFHAFITQPVPVFQLYSPECCFPHCLDSIANPYSPFCPPDLLCLFLVQLLVLIYHLPPPNPADWWSPSTPGVNSDVFYMVGWHVAIEFQPLLSLKCPRAMEVQLQAQGSRSSMWQHHQSFWGDFSEGGGAVDIRKAAHGQARCVKQDPLAGLGGMWDAESSGEGVRVAGRAPRWRLSHSFKVAFCTVLLLPAPLWGLLFPCPPRQQELT